MRAIIVDIKGNNAAVLSDDGRMSQIKNKNYTIGQKIVVKNNNYVKWVASVAAALIIFTLPAWAYLNPYSYVSLDVNPSFEFSINRFDRVLEVKAVNDDAEEILEEINIEGLKNKEIQEAVRNVLNELKNQGYIIEGEQGGVVVATSSKNEEKTNNLAETLRIAVSEEVNSKAEKPNKELKELKNYENKYEESEEDEESGIEVEVIGVSQQKVIEAKERGVTPGKINLVEKLKESSVSPEDFNVEEWLDKPVKDIMKATKENKKAAKQENKEEQEEQEVNANENGNKDAITENGNKNKGKGNGNSSSGN